MLLFLRVLYVKDTLPTTGYTDVLICPALILLLGTCKFWFQRLESNHGTFYFQIRLFNPPYCQPSYFLIIHYRISIRNIWKFLC